MRTPFLLDTDVLIAKIGGRYQRRDAKSHGMGRAGAIIAASAITAEANLKTLNVKHDPMFNGLMPAYNQ
jgi:hypothetical protein